jgi:2-oxo-3-hexenedioate decarboxylase
MSPQALLAHYDSGALWPQRAQDEADADTDVAAAYQRALALRQLRLARGEVPRGYKIGFTNRNIWSRYQVFAPIWGTVWDSTLQFCDGEGAVSLTGTCQPRLEPETVFGMRATPPVGASLDELFDCIEWVAPGFEIVQSHLPDWKFTAADTVADGGLHALHYFLQELRHCPGAPDLQAGDVITTGTWTDAWAVEPGQVWSAQFDAPLSTLVLHFQ